jgi:hypothetical protein
LETENVALQRELGRTIEGKRVILGDISREHMDFKTKYSAKIHEKDSLRQQISDIEHLIRQLRLEIEQTTTDTQRTHLLREREQDIKERKTNEERRIAKIVTEDVKE